MVMQKAVTPQLSAAYLLGGYDRVAGFVVRAEDVAWATTPGDVFAAHGLGFPGSPFTPDAAYVDVLRFAPGPTMRLTAATGGTDQATRARTGGPFVDRPPFTGLGFVSVEGHVVPLSWVEHTRLPAGTTLVRLHRDGTSQELARYVDVGHAWVSDAVELRRAVGPAISRYVGYLAQWHGAHLSADLLEDHVVVALDAEPAADLGFARTAAGRWRREVPLGEVGELFEMHVAARWNGLEMRVVDQWTTAEGSVSRVSYTGHDADLAEGLRLEKTDAAVYEASVPTSSLADVVASQLIPPGWE